MKSYKNVQISVFTSPIILLNYYNVQYFNILIMCHLGKLKKNSTFAPDKMLNNWFSTHSIHLFFELCTAKNTI